MLMNPKKQNRDGQSPSIVLEDLASITEKISAATTPRGSMASARAAALGTAAPGIKLDIKELNVGKNKTNAHIPSLIASTMHGGPPPAVGASTVRRSQEEN